MSSIIILVEKRDLKKVYDEKIKNMSKFNFYATLENFLIVNKGMDSYSNFTTYLKSEGLINIGYMGIISLIASAGALYDAFKCYYDYDTQGAFIEYLEATM